MKLVLTALLLACAAPAAAQLGALPQNLLDPEQAFRLSVHALDERSVEVDFKIAQGYYLYRDRFSFATASGEPLEKVELPRGNMKEDAFFGKTETYRDFVRIRVPVASQDAARGRVDLKVTSQGCADLGVCYLPQEQTVHVDLPRKATRP